MSGATGAGSAGTSTGTDADGGGRGSAASGGAAEGGAQPPMDTHTTQLKAVKASATDAQGTQGGTVSDTRSHQLREGTRYQRHSAIMTSSPS
ncbi:hypothetical protein AB0D38_13165, partial [Streptomyces sp. NPDC048279]